MTFFTVILGFVLRVSNKLDSVASFLPNFAVSIGIFGTFWGIFVGLYDFDTSKIAESIPKLLDGMKTAFFTSIIGMFASLLLRIYYNTMNDISKKHSTDPYKSLQSIDNSLIQARQEIHELTSALLKCFKSDEEYSLISQVKLIRQEIIDSRRDTKKAFEEFAEKFSKMASESIVDELKKVVDKFNVMLNDLVSQSFKDLQVSTERLNTWQSEYKDSIEKNNNTLSSLFIQIESLHDLYLVSIKKIDLLSASFNSIDASLSEISISGAQMEEHVRNLASQNTLLEASINAIVDAGEKASQVVPFISENMNDITKKIKELQESTNSFVKSSIFEMESGAAEFSKASKQQIEAIEKSLQNELTKSLESFAGAMVALSRQFVSDYGPLTDKLREVISIAEKVRHAV